MFMCVCVCVHVCAYVCVCVCDLVDTENKNPLIPRA
jgi:hypothetical protein